MHIEGMIDREAGIETVIAGMIEDVQNRTVNLPAKEDTPISRVSFAIRKGMYRRIATGLKTVSREAP